MAGLLFGLHPESSLAQDRDERVSFVARGDLLVDALEKFRLLVDLEISWDERLVQGKRVFCVISDKPLEAVLECIFRGTGLTAVRRLSGLYTVTIASEGPPLYGNLRGIILDSDTEQPVSSAHVLLVEGPHGRVANAEGMFLFSRLLPGAYNMRVSHIGYRLSASVIEIEAGGDSSAEIILTPDPILVGPVVIDGIGMQPSSTLLGSSVTTQEEVLGNLSSGTSGILQSLDRMSGVQVNDATADIHIQGGEAGEHQFRLDGVPVFIPLNIASFIGPFSPFALGRIKVNKAGFNVTLGSHIAGVIEAEHDLRVPTAFREGARAQSFAVQVDPLSTNGRYRASWKRPGGFHATHMSAVRVGTWRLAAPRSLQGLLDNWNTIDTFLLSAFAERNTPFANLPPEGNPSIGFFDWHSATRIRFNNLRTLYTSVYWGSSSLGNDLSDVNLLDDERGTGARSISSFTDIYRWQNGAAQARYEAFMGSHTLGSIQARGSLYRLRHDFVAPDELSVSSTEDDGNRIFELALDGRLDYMPTIGHHMEFGSELVLTGSRFVVAGTHLLPLRHESTSWRLSFFGQDKIQLGRHAVFEAGARFTYLDSRRTLYAEPRFSIRFDWKETPVGGVSLFMGSGIYRQFVSQFDISSRSPRTFVSSTRFWMGTDHSVKPAKAGHVAAEILVRPHPAWSIRMEGHYKRLFHVLAVDYSAEVSDSADNLNQSEFLRSSRGYSYGYSTVVRRTIGPGSAHVRFDYTLSKRTVEDLFRTEQLSVPWNEPFRLEYGIDVMPWRRTTILARWKGIWGRTWGFRQAYYDFLSAHLNDLDTLLDDMRANGVSADAVSRIERQVKHFDLSHPENHKLPAILQLDFSVAHTIPIGGLSLQLRADIINVLNRQNAAEWRFELDEETFFSGSTDTSGLLNLRDRPLLPRVLTFAAKLTW